jgi:ABC-type uncharacterized transport system substrate-binding protein
MISRNHLGKLSGKSLLVQVISCWLVIVGVCSGALAAESKPAKRIVILSSYQSLSPGFLEWHEGIRSVLKSTAGEPIEFYIEFLDRDRFPDPIYLKGILSFLQNKYRGKHLDLLISVGPLAYHFLLDHGNTIFPGTPAVFCAALKHEVLALERPINFTGVAAWIDVEGTLAATLKMHPKTRRVAIVGGTSESDRIFQPIAREALGKYKNNLEIIWLTELPAETILDRLSNLPSHTIVLYLCLFRDSVGNEFLPLNFLGHMAQAANGPIYGLWENLLGSGMVGGHLMSFRAQGQKAAELGRRVLMGEKPENIPVVYEGTNFYLFDWRQLKRWADSKRRCLPAVWRGSKAYQLGNFTGGT